MCTLKGFTSDAQEEEFSIEPEVGVVIAKTTMPTYIRLILNKYQFRKDKIKKALTVICTILFHALFEFQTNYNIFQQSVTQWSPSINNKIRKQKKTLETTGQVQSVNSFHFEARFGTIQ